MKTLNRRDFIARMCMTATAIVYGSRSSLAHAIIPFGFIKKQASQPMYAEDYFNVTLYMGSSASKNIVTGIDLAGKGGAVISKTRNSTGNDNFYVYDTVRGVSKSLFTNLSNAQADQSPDGITAFNSNGFTAAAGRINTNNIHHVCWTFKKGAKFFDISTWTGAGTGTQVRPHSLGVTPGMIWIKRTDIASDWTVFHQFGSNSSYAGWNVCYSLNNLSGYGVVNGNQTATSSSFSDYYSSFNVNGGTYLAYYFAHDPSPSGVIKCGSFVTDASGNASCNLDWEPQFIMLKSNDSAGHWIVVDMLRGMTVDSNDSQIFLDTAGLDNSSATLSPTSTGFIATSLTASKGYIYMAIRRPNKPVANATDAFESSYGGYNSGFNKTIDGVDLMIAKGRSNTTYGPIWANRFSGLNLYGTANSPVLMSSSTAGESTASPSLGLYTISGGSNSSLSSTVYWYFKRAPGVFDIVCYSGDGTTPGRNVNHNLGVAPELIIRKRRSSSPERWNTQVIPRGSSSIYWFFDGVNTSNASLYTGTYQSVFGSNAYVHTSTTFNTYGIAGNTGYGNENGYTYVNYLFASQTGVSKVGTYIGSASDVIVPCDFVGSARFVLLKRADGTGDWIVVDATRGSNAYLTLNTINAEVATTVVNFTTGGFTAKTGTVANAAVGSVYVFLAFA